MAQPKYQSWQAPPMAASEVQKIGWLNEHCEDGQAWQKSQRGYGDWVKAFEILSGRSDYGQTTSYRSQLSTERLKRNIKEIRGCVTDIRPIWGYSSANDMWNKQALMMNQVTQAIYAQQFMDLAIKKAFDWAATTCTGWIHPVFRRDMGGTGSGNLHLDAYGMPSIMVSQLPASGDWQQAYSVSLLDELPIYMAHSLFPDYQDRLRPTSSKYWYASEIRGAATGNIWRRIAAGLFKSSDNVTMDAFCPIRKTWIIDLAINTTGQTLYLGDWTEDRGKMAPTTPWSYAVPSEGKDMGNGRKASKYDARIYPSRRLIISSENTVMYDGPAFDWHRQLPLVPLCLDDWAFDPMGYSLVRGGYKLQQSLDELERGTMDKNRAQMDMSLAYDINAVSTKEARQYDPMEPRGRVGFDGSSVEKPFSTVVPTEVLLVRPEIFTAIEHLQQTMDYQMGINDMQALSRARGLAGTEDLDEKLAAANGPVAREMTRNVERFITMIGEQTKYIIPEFFPTRRIMALVGADKVTMSTIDYDPEKLIPAHMPHEQVHDKDQKPLASKYTQLDRARHFCDNLTMNIAPHTAHELTQMGHKLALLQLRKAGIQISSKTIAEAFNVGGFGGPEDPTEYGRYWKEQEDITEHALRIKQMADAIQQQGVEAPPGIQQAVAALTGGETQEGRPNVGLSSPQMVQKQDVTSGGERTAVSQTGS